MEFFKYDFKNTCFRLILLLIIGTIWIWFLYQLNNIYSNDTTQFFLVTNILVSLTYPIFEIILFGYHNFRNQQNIWGYLKLLFKIVALIFITFFTALVILIIYIIESDFLKGFHG
jgi:hypothetical protein